jgi:hypothetical protein
MLLMKRRQLPKRMLRMRLTMKAAKTSYNRAADCATQWRVETAEWMTWRR